MKKLTAQQRIEEILKDQAQSGLNATRLAAMMGLSKGRISQIRKEGAEQPFTYQAARNLQMKYGYSIAWILDGDGPKGMAGLRDAADAPKLVFIDHYKDAHHAAGHGSGEPVNDDGEADQIAFREDWLRAKGWHSKKMRAVPARGRSMEPRIQDGDLLLIDTGEQTILSGKIYAIRHNGERRVKRLFLSADGSLRIRSDNISPEFAEEVIPPSKLDTIEIIGRVVWIGGSV